MALWRFDAQVLRCSGAQPSGALCSVAWHLPFYDPALGQSNAPNQTSPLPLSQTRRLSAPGVRPTLAFGRLVCSPLGQSGTCPLQRSATPALSGPNTRHSLAISRSGAGCRSVVASDRPGPRPFRSLTGLCLSGAWPPWLLQSVAIPVHSAYQALVHFGARHSATLTRGKGAFRTLQSSAAPMLS